MAKYAFGQYRLCPRCGQQVYRPKFDQHDRDCLSIFTRFGSAAELARLFRSEPAIHIGGIVRQLPGVSAWTVRLILRAGGITDEELATRAEPPPDNRARCGRCTILLHARGVRPGRNDPALCWWCDGSAPQIPTGDRLPVRTTGASVSHGMLHARHE